MSIKMISSIFVTFLSLTSIALCQNSTSNATVCVNGAHIIVARASLEDPGYGILGSVKDRILARIPNSNAVPVPYPATIYGPIVYVDSEPEGAGNLTLLVKEYGDACPGRKMVLMGYSQGAQVVGDALIGSDYTAFGSFPRTDGLPQKYIDSVVAVVLMGDPANVAGQSFNKGNSTHSGNFPRNNTARWASTGLVNKTVSYCDANDTFCDSGNSIPVHLAYVEKYGSQAVDFVVQKFSASNTSTSNSSSGSSSPTSSQSAGSPSGSASGAGPMFKGSSVYVAIGVSQCLLTVLLTVAI